MSMIKREALCDTICKVLGIRRTTPGTDRLTKRELQHILAYIQIEKAKAPARERFQDRLAASVG